MLIEPEDVYRFIGFVVQQAVRNSMSNSLVANHFEMAPIPTGSSSNIQEYSAPVRPSRRTRPRRIRPSRSSTPPEQVRCQFCPNKMPIDSMHAHLMRKHSQQLQETLNRPANPPTKRQITEIASVDVLKQEHRCAKRARFGDDQQTNGIEVIANNIARPETPPNDQSTENDEPTTPPDANFGKKIYNLVHISDEQLNRFLRFGRIRVQDGQMFMNDTDELDI